MNHACHTAGLLSLMYACCFNTTYDPKLTHFKSIQNRESKSSS